MHYCMESFKNACVLWEYTEVCIMLTTYIERPSLIFYSILVELFVELFAPYKIHFSPLTRTEY